MAKVLTVRFYLVDSILDVVKGQRIAAAKIVSPLDPVVEDHPLAGPALPAALVVEALAQASSWLVMATTDFARRGVLGSFRRIMVGGPAPLGQCLDLVSRVESWADEAVVFAFEASCAGQLVVKVEDALCPLVDGEKLQDPEQSRIQYETLLRPESGRDTTAGSMQDRVVGPLQDATVGSPLTKASAFAWARPAHWLPYDLIEQCTAGESATARKGIAMSDPLFTTHFARFPVLPGALAIQSLVELARAVLGGADRPTGSFWQPTGMQGVRFRAYVRPGDVLGLTVRVALLRGLSAEARADRVAGLGI